MGIPYLSLQGNNVLKQDSHFANADLPSYLCEGADWFHTDLILSFLLLHSFFLLFNISNIVMIYETNTTPPNLQYISSPLLRGLVITPVSESIFQSSSLFHRTSFNPMNHSISLFVIFLIDLEKQKTENLKILFLCVKTYPTTLKTQNAK